MTFKIAGLREFTAAVQRASQAEPRKISSTMKKIGTEFVREAKPELKSKIKDRRRSTGKLERSMQPRATRQSVGVTLGQSRNAPQAGWWEFGGPSYPSVRPPNRAWEREGRVLYPTLVRQRPQIMVTTQLVIDELVAMIESR